MKVVKYSCGGDSPCKTYKCGCRHADIACSVYCACLGGQGCSNDRTKQALQADNDADDEDEMRMRMVGMMMITTMTRYSRNEHRKASALCILEWQVQ